MSDNQTNISEIDNEILEAEEKLKLSRLQDETLKLQEKFDYWQSKINEAKNKFEHEKKICFNKKNKLLKDLDVFISDRKSDFREKESVALDKLDEKIKYKTKLDEQVLKLKETKLQLIQSTTEKNERQFYLTTALKQKEIEFSSLSEKLISKEDQLVAVLKKSSYLNEKIIVGESKETELLASVCRVKKLRKQLSRDLSKEKKKMLIFERKISKYNTDIKEIEENISSKVISLKSKENSIEKKSMKIEFLETKIESLVRKEAQYEVNIEKQESDLKSSETTLLELNQLIQNAHLEHVEISKNVSELKSWFLSNQKEQEQLTKSVLVTSKRKKKLVKQVQDLEVLHESVELELNNLYAKKESFNLELLELSSEIKDFELKLSGLKGQVSEQERKQDLLQFSNADLSKKLEDLNNESFELSSKNEELVGESSTLNKLIVDKNSQLTALAQNHSKTEKEFKKLLSSLEVEDSKLKNAKKQYEKYQSLIGNVSTKRKELKNLKSQCAELESSILDLSKQYKSESKSFKHSKFEMIQELDKLNHNIILEKEKYTIAHASLIDIEKEYIEKKLLLESDFESKKDKLDLEMSSIKEKRFNELSKELDSYKEAELDLFNKHKIELLDESEDVAKGLVTKSKNEVERKLKEVTKTIETNLLEVQSFVKDKFELELDLQEFKDYQGTFKLKKRLFSQSKRTNQFWWGISSTAVASLFLFLLNIFAPQFSSDSRQFMANLILDNGQSARAIASIAENKRLMNKYTPTQTKALKASILDNVLFTSSYNRIWNNEKFQESLMIELSEFFLFKLHVDDSLAIEILNDQLSLFEHLNKEATKLTLSNKDNKILKMKVKESEFDKKLLASLDSKSKVDEYQKFINQFYLNYLNQSTL